jgi:hypothetical protein
MFIQYAVFVIVSILLMWTHNWLLIPVKSFNQQLATARDAKEKIAVSLALFIGTVLLMLFLAPSLQSIFNGYGALAIGFTLVSSFLIIRFFLSSLLKEMRYQRLFFRFFINPNFLLAIFFIIGTELLILYWLKEIDIDIQEKFLGLVIGYSILIIMSGIFLGFPKQSKAILREEWRLSVVAIIDPIIVVFWAVFLLEIVLGVFYSF